MTSSGTSGVQSQSPEEINPEQQIAREEYAEHDMPVHEAVLPVPDPGVEEHLPRLADVDKAAADRVERQVVTMYLLVPVMAVLFVLSYYLIPRGESIDFGPLHSSAKHVALGLTLGIGVLLIGLATQQWARQLMANNEVVEERHPAYSPADANEEALRQLNVGIDESGVPRRKMLIFSALGAVGILAAPALVLLTDLGPVAGPNYRRKTYETTLWKEGIRLVNDITYTPLKPEDLSIGQLVNGVPENLKELSGTEFNNAKAKCPIVVVRMNPADIKIPANRQDWQVSGILAYSKICTHVGCPISLWEQQTHHLLCPCHQSTFDLADSGRVLFGPAARALPQLPIKVNDEGYLVARSGFPVPVGPSFFERDSRHDLGQSQEYR
ncbi:cytochrome bc1 complex Rieske iron-sulfur subunit [Microlunatus endophyticus]|uniref:Cytochrome bc1 complex Rieske iron-sulfur subunit n=2 Tax=Microlunatus endophyticus TaxID=1716077 RepID=A0A917S0A5_9ACTN|nr:cytochrome bc1 complex Rieske iron-sulfur subunit [Microlunatus endophyticus]